MEENKKLAYRIGVTVLILLLFLTIGEFIFGAVVVGWWAPLIVIALLKAFYVIKDYMHVSRLFNDEAEGEA